MRTRPLCAVWPMIILAACVSVACAQTSTAPTTAPAATLDPEVDKILTRLEKRDVKDLHARLSWSQRYVVDEESDAITKTGEIWYRRGEPVARFLIHFTGQVADGRRDKLDERHLFDGQWYIELQSRTKTYTNREVRRPDDPGDPFSVREGVFPLPFGQKKADIVREFDVRKMKPKKDDPPATDHIRLTPREATRLGQTYKRLDFWIDREGPNAGLPTRVRVAKKDGTGKVNSYITITFAKAEINKGVRDDLFKLECPPGYEPVIETLEPVRAPTPPAEPQVGPARK